MVGLQLISVLCVVCVCVGQMVGLQLNSVHMPARMRIAELCAVSCVNMNTFLVCRRGYMPLDLFFL